MLGEYIYNSGDNDFIDEESVQFDYTDQINIALGKYMYFLAEAVHFNCDSMGYLDIEIVDNSKVILNNYDELMNSFTHKFIESNRFSLFSETCVTKTETNQYKINNCYCGHGARLGITTVFKNIEVVNNSNQEIVYSVLIHDYYIDSDELANTYNDTFIIKYVDNMWKIDEYTYRATQF